MGVTTGCATRSFKEEILSWFTVYSTGLIISKYILVIIFNCPRVVTDNNVSWSLTSIGSVFINQVAVDGSDPVPLGHGDIIGLDTPEISSVWDWQDSGNIQETFVYRINMPIIRQVGPK